MVKGSTASGPNNLVDALGARQVDKVQQTSLNPVWLVVRSIQRCLFDGSLQAYQKKGVASTGLRIQGVGAHGAVRSRGRVVVHRCSVRTHEIGGKVLNEYISLSIFADRKVLSSCFRD